MNIILDVIKWTIILGIGLFFIRSLLMRIKEKMNRIKLDDIELGYFYIKKFNELSDKIDKLSKVKIDDYDNPNWKAKVRQTLQINNNLFLNIDRGVWRII